VNPEVSTGCHSSELVIVVYSYTFKQNLKAVFNEILMEIVIHLNVDVGR